MNIKIKTNLHRIFTEKLDQRCTLAEVIPVAVYLNIDVTGKRRNQICEEINEKVGVDIYQFSKKNVWMRVKRASSYVVSIVNVIEKEGRMLE